MKHVMPVIHAKTQLYHTNVITQCSSSDVDNKKWKQQRQGEFRSSIGHAPVAVGKVLASATYRLATSQHCPSPSVTEFIGDEP